MRLRTVGQASGMCNVYQRRHDQDCLWGKRQKVSVWWCGGGGWGRVMMMVIVMVLIMVVMMRIVVIMVAVIAVV